jgi:hypothetical protein
MNMAWLFRNPLPPGASWLDRLSLLPPALLLTAAVAVSSALSLAAMIGDSCTNDEVVHLPAGYTYLATRDFRLNPEHPALAKLLAAAPLLALDPRWPGEGADWQAGRQWQFGYRFLNHSNDPDRFLFWGRLPMLFWPALLLGAVFAAARELYGPRGGFIALCLAVFYPEFLGHGHLVTTDVPVAAMMFLSFTALWKYGQAPSLRWAVYCGFMIGGALGVKFSAVLLLPIAAWLLLVLRVGRAREAAAVAAPLPSRALAGAGHVLVMGGIAWAILWGSYGFRFAASLDPSAAFSWTFHNTGTSLTARGLLLARDLRLLPEAYLYGFGYMFEGSVARNAYALGAYSPVGWWWYFPFAFLVKTPFTTLLLLGWGIRDCFARFRLHTSRDAFLVIPVIMYGTLIIHSNMNIGFRHAMPLHPFLLVLAGGLDLSSGPALWARWKPRVAAGLLALTALGVIASAPLFLAYFNLPSRLFFERHEMLVDSNLDWGQDLGRLKAYVDRHGITDLKLAYFGNASPRRLGLRHVRLRSANMYIDYEPEWETTDAILPGDTVAVSATNLVGVLFPDKDRFLSKLRGLRPFARVGHSILLYRIPSPPP